MPIIIAQLLGGLVSLAGSLVGRVLIALGLGFAQYVGVNALLDSIKSQALGLFANIEGTGLLEWAGFFQLDKHVSLIISAIGVKVILTQLQDGKKFLTGK